MENASGAMARCPRELAQHLLCFLFQLAGCLEFNREQLAGKALHALPHKKVTTLELFSFAHAVINAKLAQSM